MVNKCWFTLKIEILATFYNILVNYGQNQEIFQENCNFLEEISWSLISCFLVLYQEMCNSILDRNIFCRKIRAEEVKTKLQEKIQLLEEEYIEQNEIIVKSSLSHSQQIDKKAGMLFVFKSSISFMKLLLLHSWVEMPLKKSLKKLNVILRKSSWLHYFELIHKRHNTLVLLPFFLSFLFLGGGE